MLKAGLREAKFGRRGLKLEKNYDSKTRRIRVIANRKGQLLGRNTHPRASIQRKPALNDLPSSSARRNDQTNQKLVALREVRALGDKATFLTKRSPIS